MNDYVKLIATDAKKLWDGLDLNQKFMVMAITLVAIVSCVYFIIKATEPNWEVLYSDLAETDIASISESLKKGGHAYKISMDKKAILVPSDQREELRMFVAENDLIQDSSPGFELLDNLQLGSTDFKNKLTKQRIFQGELTRSIEKINGITKARVQLAEPERSIFSDQDEEPTASVMLILEPGYRMKASQVVAIKNLVAYAVPRLTQDKVFLTDQFGNVLTDDVSKNSNDMQSFRTSFEKDAAKKIKDTLETIMGKDNVSVQVSADLDFNSTRSTIESYVPAGQSGNGVVVSSQGEKESYKNPQPPVVVPPKTVTITTGVETPDGGTRDITKEESTVIDKDLTYEKERNSTSYAVTKEVKQVVYAPGGVKRMTVAVAVNKILTDDEKEEIKSLVAAAGGMDLTRGDMINVSSLKFSQGEDPETEAALAAEKQAATANIMDIVLKQVAPLVVFLVLGLVALSTIGSALKRPASSAPALSSDESAFDPYMLVPDRLQEEFTLEAEPMFDNVIEKKKNEITDVIASDPADAARLLTSYMRE